MRLRGVVFDLDHTLYDRESSDRIAMARYRRDHSEFFADGCSEEKAIRAMVEADHDKGHFGWTAIIAHLAEKGLFKTIPPVEETCALFQAEFARSGVLYPTTKQTLSSVRELGLATALITNGGRETQMRKIRGLGLEECFDEILVGSDITTRKPHKEIFLEMASLLKAKPEELLYVGDDPINDVRGSREAGYVPVWITTMPWDSPEVEKPKYVIDRIEEIVPLARSILFHGSFR